MEQEYLILQCPACERSVKVKSDTAGTRMGCPYCKEPIQIAEAEAEEIPAAGIEEGDDPPPSLVFRRMQTPDEETSEVPSDAGQAATVKPQGERRKHRRRHAETLGWDEEPAGETKKDSAGSQVDDDSSEFLEMDPDSPGGVRLKRVRRKKVLTAKDKLFRAITALVFVAAAIIAGFIIYSAVMQTSKVIGTETKTLQELPEEIRVLIEQARVDPITPGLTQAEEEIAVSVLSGFLNAKTVDERLRFVRNQEQVRPLMEQWYAEHPEEATKEWPDAEIKRRKKVVDQGRYFIILAVEFVGLGVHYLAIEQSLDGEMRLDWETTVGFQPMPLEKFKSERPATPVKFWAKVKLADFYNHSFSDRLKYQAVELSYPGRIEFKLIGYIDRSTDWGAELIARLEGGEVT